MKSTSSTISTIPTPGSHRALGLHTPRCLWKSESVAPGFALLRSYGRHRSACTESGEHLGVNCWRAKLVICFQVEHHHDPSCAYVMFKSNSNKCPINSQFCGFSGSTHAFCTFSLRCANLRLPENSVNHCRSCKFQKVMLKTAKRNTVHLVRLKSHGDWFQISNPASMGIWPLSDG